VDKIVPTADRAKATVLTKIRFLERDERVLPEMSAKAHFLAAKREGEAETAPAEQTVQVDRRAIVSTGQGEAVFVVSADRASRRSVQTIPGIGQSVSVVSGLSAGEKVIINPPDGLTDGAALEFND
jgi:hypothetical protein